MSSNEPTALYAAVFSVTALAVGIVLVTAKEGARDESRMQQATTAAQIERQTAGTDQAIEVALKCDGVTIDPRLIDPKTCERRQGLTGPPVRSLARPGHCDEIISDNAPPRIECAPARTAASMPRPGHCDEIINDMGDRWVECG